MEENIRGPAVAVFRDRAQAEAAVRDLERSGFNEGQIGFLIPGQEGQGGQAVVETTVRRTEEVGADPGDVTKGAALGGLLGAAAALLIPGIGPIAAGGLLATALTGAAVGAGAGAAAGGVLGALGDAGVPEDEARHYEQEFRRGRALVTVGAGDRYEEARGLLLRNGGDEVGTGDGAHDRAAAQTQPVGIASAPTAAAAGAPAAAANAADAGQITVPLVEERLDVQTREVQLGEVRIHKTVEQEQQTVPVELVHEEVRVEHRTVEPRPLADSEVTADAFEDRVIRVPVHGEEAVVSKQAIVTGEVVVNKAATTERQTVQETVRREHAEVEERYDRDRPHFQQHFAQRQAGGVAGSFEDEEPSYRTGYLAANDERFAGRSFDDAETDLRREHGGETDDAWQRKRDALREGFNRGRGGN